MAGAVQLGNTSGLIGPYDGGMNSFVRQAALWFLFFVVAAVGIGLYLFIEFTRPLSEF